MAKRLTALQKKAKEKNIPVIALAGIVANDTTLQQYFDALISINRETVDMATAMQHTAINLTITAEIIGNVIASHPDDLKQALLKLS